MLSAGILTAAADFTIKRNSIEEIDKKLDKITLKTIRVWGEDNDEADENLFFKNPADVAHDSQNNIYFADSNLNCIKVFDAHGKFLRQIGEKGQGPGTFFSPFHIGIDDREQIWVMDWGNRRFQFLSTAGKPLGVIRANLYIPSKLMFPGNGQIAYFDYSSSRKGNGIITVIDRNGKEAARIGSGMLPPKVDRPWAGGKFDSYQVAYGKKSEKYYIAYKYSQFIQTFFKDGKLGSVVFYDTPINKGLEMVWDPKKKNFDLAEAASKYSECVGITVDDNGLTFIVVTTREPGKNERTVLVNWRFFPSSKNYPEKSNLYLLMVFGPDGKVVAAKQLDTYCSGIYTHGNHLFILDTVFHKVVYEYEYTIR
jgi:hypothetical protein